MALRPEIRELVLLLAQQAARDFLAEEAASDHHNEKCPEPDGHGARSFHRDESNPSP